MTSKEKIKEWFERGVEQKKTHLIVVCDTFEYSDYPVYFHGTAAEAKTFMLSNYNGQNMQKTMEVYCL